MPYRIYQILYFLYIFLFVGIEINAQSRTCGHYFALNEQQKEIWDSNQLEIDSAIGFNLSPRSLQTIPLVFHFILREDQDSFSLDMVNEQIEILNECFNGQNHDASAVPSYFKDHMSYGKGPIFCLATREYNGKIDTGFSHRFSMEENFGDKRNIEGKRMVKYSGLGGSDAWNTNHYINIWIADLEFIQASSTFPNYENELEKGIVIDPDYFGRKDIESSSHPFHLGKTLVHEMGHFFNLQHPWGDGNPCVSDDEVEDTPLQSKIYLGCPTGPRFSCDTEDMYMNFMNFTDDECLLFFTQGQIERVQTAIDLFYPELENNNDCIEYEPYIPLKKLKISYNRHSNRIIIESPVIIHDEIDLQIFEIDGKKVLERKLWLEMKEEFETLDLPTGIYILFLHQNGNFISQKMFIY